MNQNKYAKGTYGFDKDFLLSKLNIIELKKGDAAVLLAPEYQGRVMTSTCQGDNGFSFGWINYDLISSGNILEHINPFGGEERFWLGPEGGQYSIYFKEGSTFDFENWQVPKEIDTEPFTVVEKSLQGVLFEKEMHLINYSGFQFDLKVERTINLLSNQSINNIIKIDTTKVSSVAYESINKIINTGETEWKKETGLLSVWLLSMLIPSPDATVVIPVKEGNAEELGPIVNDNYFGKVAEERLKVDDNVVYFKADGKSRSKIGIPPLRATRFIGSYDAQNSALTILETQLPEGVVDYVNSAWELQDEPYSGDALNSYNDGPLEDGSQMGPFYELESSSPAAALIPGESLTHTQRVYHFSGDRELMNQIALNLLGVSLEKIEAIF